MFLDTHAVLWLYQGTLNLFTPKGTRLLEKEDILISPVVILELQYLFEIGKIKTPGDEIISYLTDKIALDVAQEGFSDVIEYSLKERWTRDVFDRIIVAQARMNKTVLLTKDQKILDHYERALW